MTSSNAAGAPRLNASPLSSDGFLPYLAPAILFGVGSLLGVSALLVALVAR